LYAEVWQLIAGTKFESFLTPDMASKTMPDIASSYPSTVYSMPCHTLFFDAMAGVKKLANFIPALN